MSTPLNSEQHQMVKIIDDHAIRFPRNEAGDTQLLQSCYDYMGALKHVIDNTSPSQMDYICQHYEGFYRFAQLMEKLAQGIADGVIDVPRHKLLGIFSKLA